MTLDGWQLPFKVYYYMSMLKTYYYLSWNILALKCLYWYHGDSKFSDRQVWANSIDTDIDQGLHCLPFRLHLLEGLLYG